MRRYWALILGITLYSIMENKQVWLITGAGRGMGLDIAKAALAAGHSVVATGRNPDKVTQALGAADDLLVVKLDVTQPADAEAAVAAAMARFGRLDVLVNNAASLYAGYFEDLRPAQIEQNLATNLYGPMHVTRAALPVLRQQQTGLIITVSSLAGLTGYEFCTAYATAKFGLEGWMQSLKSEVAPFGIHTMLVNPGFFRTEFLTADSTNYANEHTAAYAARRARQIQGWQGANGHQPGDPAKLAQALLTVAALPQPPTRFLAGADAIACAEQVIADLQRDIDAHRALSSSLSY